MNRTKERQVAFEMIFSIPFDSEKSTENVVKNYLTYSEETEVSSYIYSTVNGVINNLDKIDDLIKKSIKNRKFERLDNVCLAVMRLAVYEMLFNDEIPTTVAINEAIEIMKKYDDSLASFVNGNLAIISGIKDE